MLSTTDPTTLSASTMERLEGISDRRDTIRANARAPRTVAAYESDWRQLQEWAAGLGVAVPHPDELTEPVPLGVLEAYLLDRSDPATPDPVAPQTLTRHLSAVRWWHRSAGLVSPTDHPQLADTIAGIRRTEATDTRRARPVYLEDLAAMVATADDSLKGLRDRALLAVGWWGAFRRSELVTITTADIADDPQGVVITLPRSKTDQEGQGRKVPLHYHQGDTCPVVSLRRWSVAAASDKKGPVFRSVDRWGNVNGAGLDGRAVARILKEYAAAVGLDPQAYSGHSLRAGFVSECDRRGIASSAVRVVTGHQTEAMLSVYTRPRSLFESSAGAFFDD